MPAVPSEPDDQPDRLQAQAEAKIALRFGSRLDMQPRLRIRLVEGSRAGPIWRPVPCHPMVSNPATALELVVALPGALARVDPSMVADWNVDEHRLWADASANHHRYDRYQLAAMTSDDRSVRVRLVAGKPWATGLLATPDHLIGLGLTTPPSGPVAVVAPTSALLVLADRGPDVATAAPQRGRTAPRRSLTDLVEVALAYATQIASFGPDHLPIEPWLLLREGSFAGRQNLE